VALAAVVKICWQAFVINRSHASRTPNYYTIDLYKPSEGKICQQLITQC